MRHYTALIKELYINGKELVLIRPFTPSSIQVLLDVFYKTNYSMIMRHPIHQGNQSNPRIEEGNEVVLLASAEVEECVCCNCLRYRLVQIPKGDYEEIEIQLIK